MLGYKPATLPPVVIESGESSLSCDPEPLTTSSTSLSLYKVYVMMQLKKVKLERKYMDLVLKSGMNFPDQEVQLQYLS